ncbi:protein prenylyltransferase [Cytidiella melzeri]|nr:protein prenylyltransferase [Cytidiella melzeri]
MSHVSGDNTPMKPPLYCEREDWTDIVPIPQYDGVNPIAPIFYNPEYKDATDYFRGIVKTGEMSQRVLELTEKIIRMNAAHYSAWQYRYRTLLAIKAPLDVELRLMDAIAIHFMKTYQVWHHRRLLLTLLISASPSTITTSKPLHDALDVATNELEFIAKVLDEDSKNYHTWSYREWILAHVDDARLWLGELPFVDDLLEADVRNNSAWHHRFFVVFSRGGRRSGATPAEEAEVLQREISFTKDKISLAPNNSSAWNYLRGFLDHTRTSWSGLIDFAIPYTQPQPATRSPDEVVDLDNPKPIAEAVLPCVAALDFLAEAYVREGGEATREAVKLWKSLADEHDTIRKYWEYRIKEALTNKSP